MKPVFRRAVCLSLGASPDARRPRGARSGHKPSVDLKNESASRQASDPRS
jgi:hypothetical protein